MTIAYTITTIRPGGPKARVKPGPVLNNAGHVAGSYVPPGFKTVYAFLYDGTVIHHLGLQTGQAGAVTALSNTGQVTGYIIVYDPNPLGGRPLSRHHACVWSHDRWEVMNIPHYRHCRPVGINNDQTMVIQCDGSQVALYHGGEYHFLCHTEGDRMQARGVNAQGEVVGYYRQAGSYGEAFLYDGTQIHTLGTLDLRSRNVSSARAINDHHIVVGSSGSAREMHAFRYDSHGMHDLGTLAGYNSEALAINNNGDIVGYASNGNRGEERALLWRQGELYDLNTLIDAPGWVLREASAINDTGQIVGYGRCDDIPTMFLLNPQAD